MLKSSPAMKGWLYFAFRGGKLLFKGMPSSIHGWKEKYLFVASRLPWGFDPTWDAPRLRENNLLPAFSDAEEEALRALRSLEGEIRLRDLLSEDALVNVGLSPAPPEEIAGMVFSDETLLARYNKRAAEAGDSRVEPRQKKPRPTPDLAGGDLTSSGNVSSGPIRKGKGRMVEHGTGSGIGVPAARAGPVSASSARGSLLGSRPSDSPASRSPSLGAYLSGSSSSARGPRSRLRRGSSASGVRVPASARPVSLRSPLGAVPSSGGHRIGHSRDHPPSSSRAHPPSSDPPSSSGAIAGPEGSRYDPRWSFSKFDSAFDDAGIAREVVRGACLPADRAQMKSGPFREFVDQAFCSAIRHLHEVEMLAEATSVFWSDARSQDKKAEALKKGLGEAQAKLREAEGRARVAESRLEDTRRRLLEIESEDALRQSALQASEARAVDLASELNGERHEKDVLRLKLQQAEDRERVAVERAETAVERFRQSEEYQTELEDEAVDGLIRGFEDFRMQAQRFCPQYDFSGLRPRLCAADYRISSEEEGFEEDSSPDGSPATPVEVEPGAPSEVAGGVALDADPAILPEAAVEAAAAEAAVEAAAAEAEVAAVLEVVPEAAIAADSEVVLEAPAVAESVPSIVDIGD